MTSLQAWLYAARPRTLLLALASISMGLFLAAAHGYASWIISFLAIFTASVLQILSNFANDYGDSKHGLDNAERQGPKRAVQSGLISKNAMKTAMLLMAVMAIISGISLVIVALGLKQLLLSLLFVALGGAAVWAAIAYTATTNPYGYVGLGDAMVFVFFGPVAVLGTYFLQAKTLTWDLLLPAIASGLLSVAVLNVNNIRDLKNDKKAGKLSIPVRLGAKKARIYHLLLLSLSFVATLIYVASHYRTPWQYLFVLSSPLLVQNGVQVWQRQEASELDPLLKQMSIATLVFTLLFGIGQVVA